MALDYGLTDTQRTIQNLAWELAVKKMKPVRRRYDETEEFPWEVIEAVRAADLMGVYGPEELGGTGGGIFETVLVAEAFSRACGGLAISVFASCLGAGPILYFGTAEQRQRWLPDLFTGKRLGAFTITEPSAGSDATAMRTTAKRDGDSYVLNGTKNFCSGGGVGEVYTTFASVDLSRGARGVTAFVVEKGTPGFTFGKKEVKMGIRASPTYELVFKDCRIPAANRLGPEGHGLILAQTTFDYSRPGIGAQAIGIAQGALDETLAYIRQRKQFGVPVSSFQAIQHMLADCATQIEAGRALLYSTSRAMDLDLLPAEREAMKNGTTVYEELRKRKGRRWTKESGMVKFFCSDVAMKTTIDCVQMCGGIGYMRDFPVEKFMRDAKITQIYEGTNQIQRNEVAAMMIKEAAAHDTAKEAA